MIQAANGRKALIICEDLDKPLDLLVTDVVLPHRGGTELVKHLNEMWSGYTANAIVNQGILDEGLNYIQKPFTPMSIISKVRDVLDGLFFFGNTKLRLLAGQVST